MFLFGNDSDPSAGTALTWFGSRELGGYAFALVVTAGYIAGDFIGHREFHLGLYRLALFVLVIVGSDFSLRSVIE